MSLGHLDVLCGTSDFFHYYLYAGKLGFILFLFLFLKTISMNRMKSKVMYLDASLSIEFACRFLSQTGLVSVEHQMQEMGLAPKDSISKKDT